MLTIKIVCPGCKQNLEFGDADFGSERYCSSCGKLLMVPSAIHSARSESNVFESSAQHARSLFADLKAIPIRQEVIPIDHTNINLLLKDFIFWAVTLLGIIPLLIITVRQPSAQLTMFALFFAFVWGVIFKRFIINDNGTKNLAIPALFFTGIVGIGSLLFIYRFLPDFILQLADSSNLLISLLGYVLQVGICEELIKSLPIFIAIKWFNKDIGHLSLITIGVFSGLGFAAFENLHYGDNAINSTYAKAMNYGVEGLVSGVQNAMVTVMLRSLSLVFCHAVFSGIVAYFITTALIRKEKMGALIVLGFMVAATLHGFYDWFAGIQPTIAALIAGLSFALFYGYLIKLKNSERRLIL
ncbi:MAG: PrsW family glutamic-type intramembrane protease [Saprospiraceae bacterium]